MLECLWPAVVELLDSSGDTLSWLLLCFFFFFEKIEICIYIIYSTHLYNICEKETHITRYSNPGYFRLAGLSLFLPFSIR